MRAALAAGCWDSLLLYIRRNKAGLRYGWKRKASSSMLPDTTPCSWDLQANGLPKELFVSGEARWLGVQPEGQAEQPRVLLLSVPYALKAADAETIGGLPPSAFVLAASPTNVASAPSTSAALASTATTQAPATQAPTSTLNFIPIFTDNSGTLGNSAAFQSGTGATAKIGINTTTPTTTLDVKGTGTVRGLFALPSVAVATATKGSNSQPIAMTASAFNSSTSAAVNETFAGKLSRPRTIRRVRRQR